MFKQLRLFLIAVAMLFVAASPTFYGSVNVPAGGTVLLTGAATNSSVCTDGSSNLTTTCTGGGNVTSITAGSNIVVTGGAPSPTVATTASPTFTTLTLSNATVPAAITIAGSNLVSYPLAFPNKSSSTLKVTTIFADSGVTVAGIVAEVYGITSNESGGLFALNTLGTAGFNGGIQANYLLASAIATPTTSGVSSGDLAGQRTSSTGAFELGGSVSQLTCDYGVTTGATLTCNKPITSSGLITGANFTATTLVQASQYAVNGSTISGVTFGSGGGINFNGGGNNSVNFTGGNAIYTTTFAGSGAATVISDTGSGTGDLVDFDVGASIPLIKFTEFGGIIPGNGSTRTAAQNAGLYSGTGVPSFSACNGSIYMDFSGVHGTNLVYANTSGASTCSTTWTAITAF